MAKGPTIQQFSEAILADHAIAIGFIPYRFNWMNHKDNEQFRIMLNARFNSVGIRYYLTKWYHTEMTACEFMALREQDAKELADFFEQEKCRAVQLKKDLHAMTNQSKKDVRKFVRNRYDDLTLRGIY